MNIFVASLPYQLEEADVRETFEEFGVVSSVKLILDKETGKKRGFGFVEMPDEEEAQKAISELNGLEVFGRSISVSKAEDKREGGGGQRPQKSFGGQQRNSGGGYNRGGNNNNSGRYANSGNSGNSRSDYNRSSQNQEREDGNRW